MNRMNKSRPLQKKLQVERKRMKRMNNKAYDVLDTVEGWRGLFDAVSSEFQSTTIAFKLKAIDKLKLILNCSFAELVDYFIRKYKKLPGYRYVAYDVGFAIDEYSDYSLEARIYLYCWTSFLADEIYN